MTSPADEFSRITKVRLITAFDGSEQIEFFTASPNSLWGALGMLYVGDPKAATIGDDRAWTAQLVEDGVVLVGTASTEKEDGR